jgi:hypothetical protein
LADAPDMPPEQKKIVVALAGDNPTDAKSR